MKSFIEKCVVKFKRHKKTVLIASSALVACLFIGLVLLTWRSDVGGLGIIDTSSSADQNTSSVSQVDSLSSGDDVELSDGSDDTALSEEEQKQQEMKQQVQSQTKKPIESFEMLSSTEGIAVTSPTTTAGEGSGYDVWYISDEGAKRIFSGQGNAAVMQYPDITVLALQKMWGEEGIMLNKEVTTFYQFQNGIPLELFQIKGFLSAYGGDWFGITVYEEITLEGKTEIASADYSFTFKGKSVVEQGYIKITEEQCLKIGGTDSYISMIKEAGCTIVDILYKTDFKYENDIDDDNMVEATLVINCRKGEDKYSFPLHISGDRSEISGLSIQSFGMKGYTRLFDWKATHGWTRQALFPNIAFYDTVFLL